MTCVGGCPDGTECETVRIPLDPATGAVAVECRCIPVIPPCALDPVTMSCSNTVCPEPDQRCIPTALLCDAQGHCQAMGCECQPVERCHIAMTATGPTCTGGCRLDLRCSPVTHEVPGSTGQLIFGCECRLPGIDEE